MVAAAGPAGAAPRVHGSKGVFCGGDWVDIEDCEGWLGGGAAGAAANRRAHAAARRTARAPAPGQAFDVVIVGAGCVGSAVARELARFKASVLLLERDDDVTQGATKGNSGIVHAGYDDKPGSVRAKFCWPGNQMFPQLDRELKFGFLKNGSLVCARGPAEEKILDELLERGHTNGVANLRIVKQEEVRAMEPHIDDKVTAALYSPDAGTVTPYEYAIALAENACDNGVDVRIRHEVLGIDRDEATGEFVIRACDWDPALGADGSGGKPSATVTTGLGAVVVAGLGLAFEASRRAAKLDDPTVLAGLGVAAVAFLAIVGLLLNRTVGRSGADISAEAKHPTLAFKAGNKGRNVTFRAKYVVNCAGLFADKVSRMVGDESFTIKPRLGDYLLLHKNQGHLARHTLFPCPDPKLGKGVLVQTTLWGNLILGPTARDVNDVSRLDMSDKEVMEYILSNCKKLVPELDAGEVIHSFCGARAKSDRGDWIIEESKVAKGFIHAAGIDSPGLAGSPAIALEVIRLLKQAGFSAENDPAFNPVRRPLITPKNLWKNHKGERIKVYKPETAGQVPPSQCVMCKCEKVTEEEIVMAVTSSLPVDNTQAVRRRTRAGMGHCQAGESPFCEDRVAEIISREKKIRLKDVGRRPWPATSLLPQRWLTNEQREWFRSLVKASP